MVQACAEESLAHERCVDCSLSATARKDRFKSCARNSLQFIAVVWRASSRTCGAPHSGLGEMGGKLHKERKRRSPKSLVDNHDRVIESPEQLRNAREHHFRYRGAIIEGGVGRHDFAQRGYRVEEPRPVVANGICQGRSGQHSIAHHRHDLRWAGSSQKVCGGFVHGHPSCVDRILIARQHECFC